MKKRLQVQIVYVCVVLFLIACADSTAESNHPKKPASVQPVKQHPSLVFMQACASDPRLAFIEDRTVLSLERSYQYSSEPSYKLTRDNADLNNLTDGRLSERRDEKIWFERHGVAWYGDHGVDIVIDLDKVAGIGEIAARFLGGREQNGLRFPSRVEVAVSSEGRIYHQVGLYRKLEDSARFGVPDEEGKAWMHTLRFRDLKARGRFVLIRVGFDGNFCATDELFVLESKHAPKADLLGPPTKRPFVFPFGPNRYTAYPLKGDWFAAGLETWTGLGGLNTLQDKKKTVTLVLDLPPDVTLTSTMLNERYGGKPVPAPEPSNIEVDGTAFRRYEIETRGLSERFWMYLFWKTEQPHGWTAPARISSRWDGGEQQPSTVMLHAVNIPEARRPTRYHVSLDWMNQSFWTRNADTVLTALDHCGFTAMPYFGMWAKKTDTELIKNLAAARKRGFEIIYNYSPLHDVSKKSKTNPEVLCRLPGGKSGQLCPSYRGPLLEKHLDIVADGFALMPASWIILDCEVHWSSLMQMTECTRCRTRRKAGESIEDFAGRMGREIFGALRARFESVRKKADGPPFRMGSYAVCPFEERYPALRFKDLYPDILDFAMPSIYTTNPKEVRKRVAAERAKMDRDAIIPWLQPGNHGEKPAAALFEEMLGSLLAGGQGVTYYTHHGFDAADLAAVAQGVLVVNEYEDLMADGTLVTEWSATTAGLGVCGKRWGKRAIWMVTSEQQEPWNGILPQPVGLDVGGTSELSFVAGTLKKTPVVSRQIELAPGQHRVFVVGD